MLPTPRSQPRNPVEGLSRGRLRWEIRKQLPGVGESGSVRGFSQVPHHRELFRPEHQLHVTDLVYSDAVLSGDRAPGLHAKRHDLGTRLLDSIHLFGVTSVEQEVGVDIAVAGVEEVGQA